MSSSRVQGISAGLTLGDMSLDTTQLQVLSKTGNEKQRKAAQKVLPLRSNGHLLLMYVPRHYFWLHALGL